jgi:UDP-N-acetylmuramate dehydrogenase
VRRSSLSPSVLNNSLGGYAAVFFRLGRRKLKIEEQIPLAPLTSLRIGGCARYFACAETEDDCFSALDHARENDLKVLVLGGGSNVLVSDEGFDGLVIQVAIESSGFGVSSSEFENNSKLETRNSQLITVGAGEDWDAFVEYCVSQNLAGVECLSGIPGFVGGTPVQNVGAYGQEVSETIVSVRCIDRVAGEIVELSNADCGFSYRTSIFNSSERDRYIVLSVTYKLTAGGEPKIVYKDLIDFFDGRKPTLKEVRDAVLKIRRDKSMVIDLDDPNSRSAGSFFKNPVVGCDKLTELQKEFPQIPFFEFGDAVKIPAAWLIENAGFHKGYVLGNAGISANHTLALINRGRATAAEIIALKDKIQTAVAAKFDVTLVPEPVLVGF